MKAKRCSSICDSKPPLSARTMSTHGFRGLGSNPTFRAWSITGLAVAGRAVEVVRDAVRIEAREHAPGSSYAALVSPSKLADGAATASFRVFTVVVVAAWIRVRLIVLQLVPHSDQDVMLQRHLRAPATDPWARPVESSPEIRVVRPSSRERGEPKRPPSATCCPGWSESSSLCRPTSSGQGVAPAHEPGVPRAGGTVP